MKKTFYAHDTLTQIFRELEGVLDLCTVKHRAEECRVCPVSETCRKVIIDISDMTPRKNRFANTMNRNRRK